MKTFVLTILFLFTNNAFAEGKHLLNSAFKYKHLHHSRHGITKSYITYTKSNLSSALLERQRHLNKLAQDAQHQIMPIPSETSVFPKDIELAQLKQQAMNAPRNDIEDAYWMQNNNKAKSELSLLEIQ